MGSFVALFYLLHHSEKVQGSILIDGGYQTKRLQEKRWKKKLLIMKRTLMNTFLIIGTNFSKVKRSLY